MCSLLFSAGPPGKVIPMECYVGDGPKRSLEMIGQAAGIAVGKSLPDLDKRFAHGAYAFSTLSLPFSMPLPI